MNERYFESQQCFGQDAGSQVAAPEDANETAAMATRAAAARPNRNLFMGFSLC
jgi:hypothetical protein